MWIDRLFQVCYDFSNSLAFYVTASSTQSFQVARKEISIRPPLRGHLPAPLSFVAVLLECRLLLTGGSHSPHPSLSALQGLGTLSPDARELLAHAGRGFSPACRQRLAWDKLPPLPPAQPQLFQRNITYSQL